MKAKVKRGDDFDALLEYLLGEDETKKNETGKIIGGNMTGQCTLDLAQEFETVASLRPNTKRPVLHFSLRMPPGQDVDGLTWNKIAVRFMEKMKLSNRPWTLVKHPDEHVHIATSRVDLNGNVWKGKFEALKAITATHELELEFDLELTPTLKSADIFKTRLSEIDIRMKQAQRERGIEPDLVPREKLKAIIADAIANSGGSFACFDLHLQANHISFELNQSKTTTRTAGITFFYEGIPFKGSKVCRAYSYGGILKLLAKVKTVVPPVHQPPPPANPIPLVVELDPEPIFDLSEGILPVAPPRPAKISTPPAPEPIIEDLIKVRTSQEMVIQRVYTPEAVLISKPEIRRSLADIPQIEWKPNDNAWGTLLDLLLRKYRLDRRMLEELKQKQALWAVNGHTLVTASRAFDTDEIIGITRMDIRAESPTPQILLPNQPGIFSIGASFDVAKKFVVTSNPIEALSYLHLKKLKYGEYADDIQVVSTDGLLPPDAWLERVYAAVEAQIRAKPYLPWGPVIATHELREAIMTPPALRQFFQEVNDFHDFMSLEVVDVAMIHSSSPAEKSTAWNAELQRYLAEVQARARDQAEEK